MSTATATRAPAPAPATATLRELALADARRYARHPLFVVGAVLSFGLTAPLVAVGRSADPVAATILPAFFLGVLGFVVAHRLTTSLRRTDEIVDLLPASPRQRTLALCLACLVPFTTMLVCTVMVVVLTVAFPPLPANASMVWFGQQPWPVVLAILLATGPVAGFGGPLLGVVVGTWAPFRGSALVGVVLLVLATVPPASASSALWRALPPWAAMVDEPTVHGQVVGSTLVPQLSPVWDLAYVSLLCALGVVVALLRQPEGRRPLLWAAATLTVAAGCAFALTIS